MLGFQTPHRTVLPFRRRARRACFLIALAAAISAPGPAAGADSKSPFEWSFIRLEYVRDDRVVQLQRLCERVHLQARAVLEDEVMAAFFDAGRDSAAVIGGAVYAAALAALLMIRRGSSPEGNESPAP